MGIERVYVADPVYETFLAKLANRVSRLRPGSDEDADYGPMTMPGQIDVISRHLADAVARGRPRPRARPAAGGPGHGQARGRKPPGDPGAPGRRQPAGGAPPGRAR